MKVKAMKLEHYQDLHDKMTSNTCVSNLSSRIDPYMSKSERLEIINKAFNPDLPMFIDLYDEDGITRYFPIRCIK